LPLTDDNSATPPLQTDQYSNEILQNADAFMAFKGLLLPRKPGI